jgi:taurine dioxygenase
MCGDIRTLSDAAVAALRSAWLENLVVMIRGQKLSDDDLIAFGQRLGDLDTAPLAKTGKEKARAHPEIIVVSNVIENGQAIGVLRDAEVVWHSDNSYREQPLSFSALYALEVPLSGGNTGFANMYRALETLPTELRSRIEGLTIKHDMTYNSAGDLREGFSPVSDVRDAPGPKHPIVRTHVETGFNALYLGRRPNAYIDGLSVDESERLLNALWAHATQPALTWHHQWRAGDIVHLGQPLRHASPSAIRCGRKTCDASHTRQRRQALAPHGCKARFASTRVVNAIVGDSIVGTSRRIGSAFFHVIKLNGVALAVKLIRACAAAGIF